jgi:stress response protein YsnF
MAAAGGATGGLIGALTQSGIGEDEAHAYAEGVRRGGTLVTARVPDADRGRIEAIMQRYAAMDATTTVGAAHRAGTTVGATHGVGEWSGDRIVAVFENTDRACAAREALIAAGIDNAKMELVDHRSDLDNWTAIKRHAVPDDDAHLYAEGLGRGHTLLVIQANAGEHDRIMKVLETFDPIDIDEHAARWRKAGWAGMHPGKAAWDVHRQASTTATGSSRTTQEQVVPVYEERLKVGKRVVQQQGHVRVRVYTVEHPVQEGLTLREERVSVERRPVDRPAAGMPGGAFQDRTIDVTTHREEPVIAKEARVKEEIVVRKEADQRQETVRDTVRETKVEVEDDRVTATPPSPSTNPPRR